MTSSTINKEPSISTLFFRKCSSVLNNRLGVLVIDYIFYRWRKSRKRLAAASVAEGGRLGRGGKVNGTMAGSAAVANGGIANNNAYGKIYLKAISQIFQPN